MRTTDLPDVLFVPALSGEAALAFARAVWRERLPMLEDYREPETARAFADQLGPKNVMNVYQVTRCARQDGFVFEAELVERAIAA